MKVSAALMALTLSVWASAAPISVPVNKLPHRGLPPPEYISPSGMRLKVDYGVSQNPNRRSRLSRLKGIGGKMEAAQKPVPLEAVAPSRDQNSRFPPTDSSIVKEETRAHLGETERQEATEWEEETRAASSAGEGNADTLVVGLVLSFVAVLLIVELWTPIRRWYRRSRVGHGPIHLAKDEKDGGAVKALTI
ncbi:hypothetical protein GGR56DRAFT_456271 [Xylariaceae sp. FL0804]|nr:hypothetical protein GGR56DRAFT_456271 [Xylariaceae sp. FL0804]